MVLTNHIDVFANGQDIFRGVFVVQFIFPECADDSIEIQQADIDIVNSYITQKQNHVQLLDQTAVI